MEVSDIIKVEAVEESTIAKKPKELSYPKKFSGVVETAKNYIKAGHATKDIASCIYDELESAGKTVILKAFEEGCNLSRVHSFIYYYNIQKKNRTDNTHAPLTYKAEANALT